MRHSVKNLFLLPTLIAGLGLLLANWATAQTFAILHNFTNGSDGSQPYAPLLLSGNTLYGAAVIGGNSDNGIIFAINTDGTNFTNLYSFTATSSPYFTNSDGAFPEGTLILSGNTLYGTANQGGIYGYGTVFSFNTDGTSFTNLHSFTACSGNLTNSDGAYPTAGLILSGNTLYGTAQYGGTNGNGTVFSVNTDGKSFTNLHTFTATPDSFSNTNRDGALPTGGLVLLGSTLYGTAIRGGTNGYGTVFGVNINGTGFRTVHNFSNGAPNGQYSFTNSDATQPQAGLILSGNILHGTALGGGTNGFGTVFAVNTNGTGFVTLYNFSTGTQNALNYPTNSDGAYPYASLILLGSTLYGTATQGGTNGTGTVFAINTNGPGFANLLSFSMGVINVQNNITNSVGVSPSAGLILSGNTLYGMGSVWRHQWLWHDIQSFTYPSPQLTIVSSGTNVNVTWPSGVAGYSYNGYTLQSTTNLILPAVWSAVSATPAAVNTNNVVTNSVSGAQTFYRLSQ